MEVFKIIYQGETYEQEGADFEDAVEKWAEDYDENSEMELLKNMNSDVICINEKGIEREIDLCAESIIQYSAYEK